MERRQTRVLTPIVPVDSLTYHRFELSVVAGPNKGVRKTFGQETVRIGSAQTNDVILDDPAVSRFHAKVQTLDGKFILVDTDSTNGTYLGSHRIRSAYLEGDAVVRMGDTQLRFRPLGDETTVELPSRDQMGGLIGRSPRMRALYDVLQRVASSDMSVIIHGETGTGKELVARIVHDHSARARERFEVLDCGAVPESLIQSELFGHVRGAFTGADHERQGIFERASGGTVFLDEVGELSLDLQPKLLRVLEIGEIRRVGGNELIKVNVRVVAATHRPLRDMVNRGKFREDLYYRLAGCMVELPPLRDRPEDIPLLVQHFLAQLAQNTRAPVPSSLPQETLDAFVRYGWPGNVRQLRNAVERAAIMGSMDLGLTGGDTASEAVPLSSHLMPLKEAKAAFERRYLIELVQRHKGDLDAASKAADVHPKSLARLLRRYDIGRH